MLRKPVWKNVKYLLIRWLREMRCLAKWHSLSTWTLLITFRTFHVGPIFPYKIEANFLAIIRTCNVVSTKNKIGNKLGKFLEDRKFPISDDFESKILFFFRFKITRVIINDSEFPFFSSSYIFVAMFLSFFLIKLNLSKIYSFAKNYRHF